MLRAGGEEDYLAQRTNVPKFHLAIIAACDHVMLHVGIEVQAAHTAAIVAVSDAVSST